MSENLFRKKAASGEDSSSVANAESLSDHVGNSSGSLVDTSSSMQSQAGSNAENLNDLLSNHDLVPVAFDATAPLSSSSLRAWWRELIKSFRERILAERQCYDILDVKLTTSEEQFQNSMLCLKTDYERQRQNTQQQYEKLRQLAENDYLTQIASLEREHRIKEQDLRDDQTQTMEQVRRKLQHDQWELRSIHEGQSPGAKIQYHQTLRQFENQLTQQASVIHYAQDYLRSARMHKSSLALQEIKQKVADFGPALRVEQSSVDSLAVSKDGAEIAPQLPSRSIAELQQQLRESFLATNLLWKQLQEDWRYKLTADFWPLVITILPGLLVGGLLFYLLGERGIFAAGLTGAIVTFLAAIGVFIVIKMLQKRSATDLDSWRAARESSIEATQQLAVYAHHQMLRDQRHLREKLQRDLHETEERFLQKNAKLQETHHNELTSLQQARENQSTEHLAKRDATFAELERKFTPIFNTMQRAFERETAKATAEHQRSLSSLKQERENEWRELVINWRTHQQKLRNQFSAWSTQYQELFPKWNDRFWASWKPTNEAPRGIPFGELHVEQKPFQDICRQSNELVSELPPQWHQPAVLDFPRHGSLVIQASEEGRDAALQLMQAMLLRLLLSLPPAKSRFTIIDPVGLGKNFAGMMHLVDYDDTLVTNRIWTEPAHIEQRLIDLSEQIEVIIQKYLRNEYASIDAYNIAAGEVAEPFRFLVVANFPRNFTESAARRLISIANSGPRCGVFILLMADMQQNMPAGFHFSDMAETCEMLEWRDGKFHYNDADFGKLPFTPLAIPDEETITRLVHTAGHAARDGRRVEVPFAMIAPPETSYWQGSTQNGIDIPLGRAGARKKQSLKLGSGTSQHVLMAGKTGSGKSTLLHTIIINAALIYSPDECELYMIDFKKGVEFKDYALFHLPHARVIAIESEREFGLSVLQRLDAEMQARGELFREHGKQDIGTYRSTSGVPPLPRILLLIDEFQEFFTEDDRISQQATLLLDRLVRQGRAFGIHLLLGSQTLGGAYTLARSTISQMAVRIALQCSEADADLILNDDNSAARLLNRPGEAIYNDANGRLEGNNPFQVAWLGEAQREEYLRVIREMADEKLAETFHSGNSSTKQDASSTLPAREQFAIADWKVRRQVVFEGSSSADLRENRMLAAAAQNQKSSSQPLVAWLGDPVSIKDPTSITMRRQAGTNLLILGHAPEQAHNLLAATLVSFAAQGLSVSKQTQSNGADSLPSPAGLWLLEAAAGDTAELTREQQTLTQLAADLKLPHLSIARREIPDRFEQLSKEIERRQSEGDENAGPIFLVIHNLSRFRDLRRDENDIGYSFGAEPQKPSPDKLWQTILREGPAVGIHTLVWCDTLANLMRAIERSSLREFDLRVLFQMNANDSSQMVDSPAATKLGRNFALFSHEETGQLEKFRPYFWPDADFLKSMAR